MSGVVAGLLVGAAVGLGVFQALEASVVEMPSFIPSDTPNMFVGLAAFSAVFFVIFGLSMIVSSGPEAKASKKKKKKKASKPAEEAKAQPNAQPKAQPQTKKEKKKQQEEPAPSKKNKKKGNAQKAAPAPEKKAPEKKAPEKKAPVKKAPVKKEKKKSKASSTEKISNKWAALELSDSSSDDSDSDSDFVPTSNKQTKGGAKQASSPAPASSSSSRRRRRHGNKDHSEEAGNDTGNTNNADMDGFVVHKVKRRVRKQGGGDSDDEGGSSRQQTQSSDPNAITIEIDVPVKKYGFIIGPKAVTLKKLEEATQTRISFPKGESQEGEPQAKVKITGSKEGCGRCKAAIHSLVKQGFSSITDPGRTSANVHVDKNSLHLIIGKKGETINKIKDALDVGINVADRDPSVHAQKIVISGEKEAVNKAKEIITMLGSWGYSTLTHPGYVKEYVNFPPNEYSTLIGPSGQTIKSIQGDTKTNVVIPSLNDEEDRVAVIGLPADVKRAIIQIDHLLDEDYQAAKQAKKMAQGKVQKPSSPFDDDDDDY